VDNIKIVGPFEFLLRFQFWAYSISYSVSALDPIVRRGTATGRIPSLVPILSRHRHAVYLHSPSMSCGLYNRGFIIIIIIIIIIITLSGGRRENYISKSFVICTFHLMGLWLRW